MIEKVYTNQAPEAIGPYSQGVKFNGMLFTSGQIAINPQSGEVEEQTISGQTKQVMANLKAVLTASGTDFSKVIKTTCFLKNMSDFAEFNEIYGEYFTEKPARSCVAAKELPKNVLVEVEVIAAL